MENKYFFTNESLPLTDLNNGIKRKVLSYREKLMSVEVYFEQGAIGAVHTHPNEQISYIVSGEFEYQIGDEKKVLQPGDTTYIPGNLPHGAVCLKKGLVLDIFTPQREDYL